MPAALGRRRHRLPKRGMMMKFPFHIASAAAAPHEERVAICTFPWTESEWGLKGVGKNVLPAQMYVTVCSMKRECTQEL